MQLISQDTSIVLQFLDLELEGLAKVRDALRGELSVKFSAALDLMERLSGRLIVTGVGKSGHIGRKLAATFASTGTPAQFVHAADAAHGDLGMLQQGDVVLALSWSGASTELTSIVARVQRLQIPLIVLTSQSDGVLSRAATVALVLPDVVEACPHGLTPTTSAAVQLVVGDALAICLMSRRSFSSDDFRHLHPGGRLGAQLRTVGDLMHVGSAIPVVSDESTILDAIFEMTSKRFGVTGVVDRDQRLVGVISDGDLRRALPHGIQGLTSSDVMTRGAQTIKAEVVAEQALRVMNEKRITSLFVLSDSLPIGIVTVHDLLRNADASHQKRSGGIRI